MFHVLAMCFLAGYFISLTWPPQQSNRLLISTVCKIVDPQCVRGVVGMSLAQSGPPLHSLQQVQHVGSAKRIVLREAQVHSFVHMVKVRFLQSTVF